MKMNTVNTVLTVNGQSPAIVMEGCGQKTIAETLKHFPLVKRGVVHIVKLEGWMINGKFLPFNPGQYAIRHRRD